MNQLGIALKVTYNGAREPIVANPGAWTKRVDDIRTILNHVPAAAKDPSLIVTFLTFGPDGTYITVAHGTNGRPGDNVAGWIFIPSAMQISGTQVLEAVKKVQTLINNNRLPEAADLAALFSQTYPLRPFAPVFEPSTKSGLFAVREAGVDYTWEELLGPCRYQSYYSQYQAVFLMSDPNLVTDAVNISTKPLEDLIIIPAPTHDEIVTSFGPGQGIEVSLMENKQPFTAPIARRKGQTFELIVKRKGFEGIKFEVEARQDGVGVVLPKPHIWKMKVTPASFRFVDSKNRVIENVNISINDVQLTTNGTKLGEDELNDVRIRASHRDYDTYQGNIALQPGRVVTLPLNRKQNNVTKKIELADGHHVEVTFTGAGLTTNNISLAGYRESRDGTFYPENTGAAAILPYILGAVGGALLVGVAWILFAFVFNTPAATTEPEEPEKTEEVQKGAKETGSTGEDSDTNVDGDNTTVDTEQDYNAAIDYLEQDKWYKNEMDNIKGLEGLFDAVNDHKFDKAIQVLQKYTKSPKVSAIIENMKNNRDKTFSKKYNYSTNTSNLDITVQGYINHLNQASTPEPPANAGNKKQGNTQDVVPGGNPIVNKPGGQSLLEQP